MPRERGETMRYYINLNAQSNGDHEVHKETCYYYLAFKSGSNFKYIGTFSNEVAAVRYAKTQYPNYRVDGCSYCCSNAHKH